MTLIEGEAQGDGDAATLRHAIRAFRRQERRQRGKGDERQDHEQVFDDQPADGDAALFGGDEVAFLQSAQQNDSTGDGERETEHNAGAERPSEHIAETNPKERGAADLDDGAGDCDGSHRQKIGEGEVKPDAEHQKDDADLGQFGGKALVGNEARCERTNRDAREQITDDR